MAAIVEACPPPDTGRGRGPLAASYCEAMTQMTMGGAGVSEANGVLHNRCHFLIYCSITIYIYNIFPKQVFGPKSLRRCTKTVHSDAFLFATHVFRSFFLRRCTCGDLCIDYGLGNDTVVLRSPVKPGMTVLSL